MSHFGDPVHFRIDVHNSFPRRAVLVLDASSRHLGMKWEDANVMAETIEEAVKVCRGEFTEMPTMLRANEESQLVVGYKAGTVVIAVNGKRKIVYNSIEALASVGKNLRKAARAAELYQKGAVLHYGNDGQLDSVETTDQGILKFR